ncbi:MAG: hypothetical protein IPG85_08425 [Bacteroidetes bacterium]|nr:hypothetical protein [Bacteroidota bacterium]
MQLGFILIYAGTYTVTATDANNNTTSTTATVGGPTQIVWNNAVATNVTCFGAGNGLINVAASGGVGLILIRLRQ